MLTPEEIRGVSRGRRSPAGQQKNSGWSPWDLLSVSECSPHGLQGVFGESSGGLRTGDLQEVSEQTYIASFTGLKDQQNYLLSSNKVDSLDHN